MPTNRGPWRLNLDGDKNVALIPDSLEFFFDRFTGRRMVESWSAPPVSISNKSKPLADFLSWMIQAPVVSERARSLLGVFVDHLEFIPLLEMGGTQYFAVNVVTVLRDVLDTTASCVDFLPGGTPYILRTAVFVERDFPPIFKVGISESHVFPDVFVTRPFANILVENNLTGCRLLDPEVDLFAASISGRALTNVVEGVITKGDRRLPRAKPES